MFEEKREGHSHRKLQGNGNEGEQRREPEGLPEARIRPKGAEIPEPDKRSGRKVTSRFRLSRKVPATGRKTNARRKAESGARKA
jgi:hypothetical protein